MSYRDHPPRRLKQTERSRSQLRLVASIILHYQFSTLLLFCLVFEAKVNAVGGQVNNTKLHAMDRLGRSTTSLETCRLKNFCKEHYSQRVIPSPG